MGMWDPKHKENRSTKFETSSLFGSDLEEEQEMESVGSVRGFPRWSLSKTHSRKGFNKLSPLQVWDSTRWSMEPQILLPGIQLKSSIILIEKLLIS